MRFLQAGSVLLAALCIFFSNPLHAQESLRCATVEAHEMLRERHPEIGSDEEFEEWLQKSIEAFQQKSGDTEVVSLPVVFHVIHTNEAVGGNDNLSPALINAQLEQINNDFRRIQGSSGFNTNPVGADTRIEFCMAIVDPNGEPMAEPGVNRVNTQSLGFNTQPYSIQYMDNTVKPITQWDPAQYINIWVARINFFFFLPIEGYAQFPSQSGLPGLNPDEGPANSDGVVVRHRTVGSTDLPNPQGGNFGQGRTLTHELGHFFGLRHIWGDGNCSADDFCDDTPNSSGSTSGCPSNKVTCDTPDMIENYMDYTDDACMNIFTMCQKTRMQAVMANSPRRGSLINSTACGIEPEVPPCENPYPQVENLQATVAADGSVELSWTPIPGSLGCQVQGGLASGNGPVQNNEILGDAPSSFVVSAGLLNPNTEYRWRVRCGCSRNPLVAGPWTPYNFFTYSIPSGAATELLAMRKASSDFGAHIYPNPSKGLFQMEVTAEEGVYQVSVYNALGLRLKADRLQLPSGTSTHELDLHGYAAGIYFVKIESPTVSETVRIAVQQ